MEVPRLRHTYRAAGAVAALTAIGACTEPAPRTYSFFMEDSIARDGVLARCDREPERAQRDLECANARRAATAVLLSEERQRREELERESERKLEALRRQVEAEQRALKEAELAEAERAAYEALYDAPLPGAEGEAGGLPADAADGAAADTSELVAVGAVSAAGAEDAGAAAVADAAVVPGTEDPTQDPTHDATRNAGIAR